MKTSNRGFLRVTVLLVLFVVLSLGAVLLGKASSDSRFVQHEISNIQTEKIACSSLAYYKAHGVPPLVVEISQAILSGTSTQGNC